MVRPNGSASEYEKISNHDLQGGIFSNAALGSVLLRPFLNNLFWNFISCDGAATFTVEVGKNPERIMPRSLKLIGCVFRWIFCPSTCCPWCFKRFSKRVGRWIYGNCGSGSPPLLAGKLGRICRRY